ncbi:MAG: polysaccharide pyruvyl transferase family protein, partial [Eubacterium sp.]|nr:polysaccharide pyruvyl transferase family protein [Eubacterium sp.]
KHYKLLHFNSALQLASDIVYLGDHIRKKKGFSDFRKKHLVLSKKSYSTDDIKDTNSLYRVFITGSDQVFNYTNTGFDETYFLSFVEKPNSKCAYAASFGFHEVPVEYMNRYKDLLKGFEYISFREQSGSELYNMLTLEHAQTLLDPTLVARRKIWDFGVNSNNKCAPYILVYFLERSSKAFAFVNLLKQLTGLKVIYIGSLIKRHRENLNAEFMGGLSPDEFVNLIKNATYVVTNSFHGTAFSIVFEKQFWVNPLENGKVTNDRFFSLLNQTGLINRIIPNDYNGDYINNTIDYIEVNVRLDKFRQEAVDYLIKICKLDEVGS